MSGARNQIIVGDARQELRRQAPGSADMVLTSPPYFRLRDYTMPGQLGLETHVDDWVRELRGVAGELGRVLTPTGSFWLNVADTYATRPVQGGGRKSLLLGPERLALGLIKDGWLLRNKIVWQKANPRPSSVRDRLTCSWEALYVFVKQPRYFFDLDRLRVPHTSQPAQPRRPPPDLPRRSTWRGPNSGTLSGLAALKAAGQVGHPLGKNPGDVWRLAASGYRGAHHATFPVALAERAIRAGCPEARCAACRAPWDRPLDRPTETTRRGPPGPTCDCRARQEPGLVLDPFFGAGSTALAAEALGRDWLGIELNPAFARTAEERIVQSWASPRRRHAAA